MHVQLSSVALDKPVHSSTPSHPQVKLSGNHLKGSRPVLSFDASFDTQPHTQLLKEMLTQVRVGFGLRWACTLRGRGALSLCSPVYCLAGKCRGTMSEPGHSDGLWALLARLAPLAGLSCHRVLGVTAARVLRPPPPDVRHPQAPPQGQALLRPRAVLHAGGWADMGAQLPGRPTRTAMRGTKSIPYNCVAVLRAGGRADVGAQLPGFMRYSRRETSTSTSANPCTASDQ